MLTLKSLLSMQAPLRLATIATISSLLFATPSLQQTYSSCNPTQQQCPPNPALGGTTSVSFTGGASDQFTASGNPVYDSNGVGFTISQPGDSPMLTSNWYIMFGTYTVKMKAAPGAGIVSSIILISDDLDEIDWEWLGARDSEVQSNFFGKGQTTTYTRGAVHAVDSTQGEWHDYSIIWTENQIVWQIDGTTVRVLNADDAQGQFPQTPCQLRMGAWSGGDSSNPQGTIAWAMGPTDYSSGPYTMYVQSVSVEDYSTGTKYTWEDTSGAWTSISSDGGSVNGNAPANVDVAAAPQITTTANSPQAFAGTGADGTETTQTGYPWAASASSWCTSTYTYTGSLPTGWTFDSCKGQAVPPSKASPTLQSASSTRSPVVSLAGLCSDSGYEVVTSYDQRGFLTTATVPVGISTGYDDRGFPTTRYPPNCQASSNPPIQMGQVLAPSGITRVALGGTTTTTTNDFVLSATSGGSDFLAATATGANAEGSKGNNRYAANWTLVAAALSLVMVFAFSFA